jgi:hypothetical protein
MRLAPLTVPWTNCLRPATHNTSLVRFLPFARASSSQALSAPGYHWPSHLPVTSRTANWQSQWRLGRESYTRLRTRTGDIGYSRVVPASLKFHDVGRVGRRQSRCLNR